MALSQEKGKREPNITSCLHLAGYSVQFPKVSNLSKKKAKLAAAFYRYHLFVFHLSIEGNAAVSCCKLVYTRSSGRCKIQPPL